MARPKLTTAERFWRKVDKSAGPDACWPWLGHQNGYGYGLFLSEGGDSRRRQMAHVCAWVLVNGPLPAEKPCALHSCDMRYPVGSIEYRKCCNPAHLWPGTKAENMADRDAKGRQAKGDRHGSRLRPETLRRGDEHWTRRHPEWISGERNPAAAISEAVAREILAALKSGATGRSLVRKYGVSDGLVSRLKRGETWAHLPR